MRSPLGCSRIAFCTLDASVLDLTLVARAKVVKRQVGTLANARERFTKRACKSARNEEIEARRRVEDELQASGQ